MPFYVTDHIIVGILTDQQNKGSKNATIIDGKRAVAGKDRAGPSSLSVSHRIPVLQAVIQSFTVLEGSCSCSLLPLPWK